MTCERGVTIYLASLPTIRGTDNATATFQGHFSPRNPLFNIIYIMRSMLVTAKFKCPPLAKLKCPLL